MNEPEEVTEFGNTNHREEVARRIMSDSFIPAKTWAYKLSVTERVAQMWIAGAKEIPPNRVDQIFSIAPDLLHHQKETIDGFIMEMLVMAYGPNAKEAM